MYVVRGRVYGERAEKSGLENGGEGGESRREVENGGEGWKMKERAGK